MNLNRHLLSHTDEQNFISERCNKGFLGRLNIRLWLILVSRFLFVCYIIKEFLIKKIASITIYVLILVRNLLCVAYAGKDFHKRLLLSVSFTLILVSAYTFINTLSFLIPIECDQFRPLSFWYHKMEHSFSFFLKCNAYR